MPIVSGTLSADGASTLSASGTTIRTGFLFSFGLAAASWLRLLAGGVCNADGLSTASFTGSTHATLRGAGAFTYDPLPISTFAGIIRREPQITLQHSTNVPTQAAFMVSAVEPLIGQDISMDFGTGLIFSGTITSVEETLEDSRNNPVWKVQALDHLFKLNGRFPYGCFTDESITDIVTALFATFAPDFTVVVDASLPSTSITLDGTLSFLDCLQELSVRSGATFTSPASMTVKFSVVDTVDAPGQVNNDPSNALLLDPPIAFTEDITQIRNRVNGYGASTTLTEDANPGDDTLAVADVTLFNEPGTISVGCQRLGYGGVKITTVRPQRPRGGGGFTAEIKRDLTGGVMNGKIRSGVAYEMTFVQADGSETAPTFGAVVQGNGMQDTEGGSSTGFIPTTGGSVPQDVQLVYQLSVFTAEGEYFPGGSSGIAFTLSSPDNAVSVPIDEFLLDSRSLGTHIWRTKGVATEFGPGGTDLFYLVGTAPKGATTFLDTQPDSALTQLAPITIGYKLNDDGSVEEDDTAFAAGLQFAGQNSTGCQVQLSNLPLSPASSTTLSTRFTSNLTPTNGTVENATGLVAGTHAQIVTSDGTFTVTLTDDTVGDALVWSEPLPSPPAVGDSVTSVTADAGHGRKLYRCLLDFNNRLMKFEFLASLDNTTREYTDNKETYDPRYLNYFPFLIDATSGAEPPGDTLPPTHTTLITGVSGIEHTILKGTTVTLFLQVDDVAAQAYLAARIGGDGVRESVVQDSTLKTASELRVRTQAELTLFSMPLYTVKYPTRDPKSVIGKDVDIDLINPPIVATLKIQDVTVDQIHENDDLLPRYLVTASTVAKQSLIDLLRRAKLRS